MTSVEGIPACLLAGVPIVQPTHLDGDASLATEILPGPPPLVSIQQAGIPRKDHKKTGPAFSYLPVNDPGTTYTGHMMNPIVTTAAEVDGPRRKRARFDKGSTSSRAQRASARNLTAIGGPEPSSAAEAVASSSQLISDSDGFTMQVDSDCGVISRSNSIPNGEEAGSTNLSKRPRRDKGKGREKEPVIRVKEEPVTVSLGSLYEPVPASLPNEDHCSACRSFGSLVYCDGCPRAFHLWCLNPPMEAADLPEGESRWYCPACTLRQIPPAKPSASLKFMAPLVDQIQSTIPTEFQLPPDIRAYFKDVATSSRGAFVDSSEIKPPRLNRHGQLEDRDPYRLKDRNGDPVLCFRCGISALPPGVAAAAPATKRARRGTSTQSTSESGRGIISCDYCHLHWHLDCLDPPLAYVPAWGKKWMCPNHSEQITHSKRRVPRQNNPPIEITKPRQFNNGNIEVIQPETSTTVQPKVAVDEVLINGRRYRVPERIITMDFWGKAKKVRNSGDEDDAASSGLSSPLTSLSSLDEFEEKPHRTSPIGLFDVDELKAALFLCNLQAEPSTASKLQATTVDSHAAQSNTKKTVQPAVEHTPSQAMKSEQQSYTNGIVKEDSSVSKRPVRSTRASKAASVKTLRSSSSGVRSSQRLAKAAIEREPTDASMEPEPAPQLNGDVVPSGLSSLLQASGAGSEEAPVSSISSRPKRVRQPPRGRHSPVTVTASSRPSRKRSLSELSPDASSTVAGPSGTESDSKPLASIVAAKRAAAPGSKSGAAARSTKPITPAPPIHKHAVAPLVTPTVVPPSSSTLKIESTPTTSLKIRLPRLGAIKTSIAPAPPSTSGSQETNKVSPSRPKSKKATGSRNRRSSARQASSAAPLNESQLIGLDALQA